MNLQEKEGNTALMIVLDRMNFISTWDGNEMLLKKVELLLAKGADVNLKNNEGKTALMIVLSENLRKYDTNNDTITYNLVKLLLDHNAEIYPAPKTSYSYPTSNPYSIDVSKLLLERGIDFIGMLSCQRVAPLTAFAASGQTELVKFCLDRGDDVNEADEVGKYPLWCAVERKHFDIFELLFEKGANSEMRPNDKKSAIEMLKENKNLLASFLQNAVKKENYNLVKFLLKIGTSAEIRFQGRSALEILQTKDVTSILVSSKSVLSCSLV